MVSAIPVWIQIRQGGRTEGCRLLRAVGLSIALAILSPQAQALPTNSDLETRLAAVVHSYEKRELFSGSVLITQYGQTLFRQGFGFADRAAGQTSQPDTRFLLASITKQFTAVLVLQQVERGQIRTQAPIEAYLPNLPLAWRAIKVHELLNHSSGIPDELSTPILNPMRNLNLKPEQVVDRLRSLPVLFKPGDHYSYSNTNYLLLGMILEHVTGLTLREQLQQEVFEPLGLSTMGIEAAGGLPAPAAKGYRHSGNQKWLAGLPIHPSILFGSGDLYAAPDDLNEWTEVFWNSYRLIGHATRELMTTPSAGKYGYGFRTDTPADLGKRREIYHTGSVKGFSNYLGRFVDDGLTVVVMGNLTGAPSRTIAHQLATIALSLAPILSRMPERQ